ncbi:mCG117183 [Mus musculus]|nr:mCG117183 [Mus musculus]
MTLLSHLQFKMTASSQATNSVLMKGAGLPEENSFAFQLHLETVDMALPSLKPLH